MTINYFTVNTNGHTDVINITDQVTEIVEKTGIKDGIVLIFIPGSTAAITSIEYESGALQDLKNVLEKIAPEEANYKHHQKWHDKNGAAHIKSAMIGTDYSIPIIDGHIALGTWQQIVLIDFDEKPREREVLVKIVKE